jgi:hypothetical protein
MERDTIVGHGISDFVRESYMKRADSYTTVICNGCGTIPIYNNGKHMYICPMCDGPVRFIGDVASSLEIIPPNKRSLATFSQVEIPYATKVLEQELGFFMNISMRMLTSHDVTHLRGAPLVEMTADQQKSALDAALPERTVLETVLPEMIEAKEETEIRPEQLAALGLAAREDEEAYAPAPKVNTKILNAAVEAAVNATLNSGSTSTNPSLNKRVSSEVVAAAVNAAVAAAKESRNFSESKSAEEAVNTTEVQTLAFSTPAPVMPLPQISEPSGLGDEDYETLSPGQMMSSSSNSNSNSNNSASSSSNSNNSSSSSASSNSNNSSSSISNSKNFNNSAPMSQQQQQGGGGNYNENGVNVQTTTQPVLVVPLSMTSQPSAQLVKSPAPGAPATFAVDTSSLTPSQPRSRSGSGSSRGSTPGGTPRVNVTKTGGSSESMPSAPNTRVTVVKHN